MRRGVEWVGRGRKTDEKHGEDHVEEGFHLARVKLDRVTEDNSESIAVECYCYLKWRTEGLLVRDGGMYNAFIGYGL